MLKKLLGIKPMGVPCDSGIRRATCTAQMCTDTDRTRTINYYDSMSGQKCKTIYSCGC
jgi:hypothetical protein